MTDANRKQKIPYLVEKRGDYVLELLRLERAFGVFHRAIVFFFRVVTTNSVGGTTYEPGAEVVFTLKPASLFYKRFAHEVFSQLTDNGRRRAIGAKVRCIVATRKTRSGQELRIARWAKQKE